ncbi:RNA polymerase [Oyo virus]|uniref:RNA-directed RNA polymerase L n=1 Tax=Oyo virus TaxID=1027632 RepID=I1STB8_9VIRU|nr:RNA polymerase [Oyo virus]AEE01391.1 RNA polymerase [Oyo virus]
MDPSKVNQFRHRINAVKEATLARDILSDMYMARHEYFATEYCLSNNIEYRNDVRASEIYCTVYPDRSPFDIERIRYTPDNYVFLGDRLYIIDFKVSTDSDSSIETYNKYINAFQEFFPDIEFEVVIVRCNPMSMQITINSDSFQQLFPNIPTNLSFHWFFELRRILLEKFRDNEEFQDMIDHGDFTLTAPWLDEDTEDLYTHPVYLEFIESLSSKHESLFQRSLNFDAYSSQTDKWNSNLIYLKEKTTETYNNYVHDMAQSIFETPDIDIPTKDKIIEGWNNMYMRIQNERELSKSPVDQKPSIHFIWGKPDKNKPTGNNEKIIRLSKSLQGIKDNTGYANNFKSIGILSDFSSDVNKYENFCSVLKKEARSKAKPNSKGVEPIKIKNCTILWEQQFKYEIIDNDKYSRSNFYKNYLGIGKHKQFKDRTDIDLSRPKILDFEDMIIKLASKTMIQKAKSVLNDENILEHKGCFLDEYIENIKVCSVETFDFINKLTKTNFWSSINDFSILMKNMLSVSQYNKYNTFRIVTCANNNLFGIVFPSSNIRTKKSTIVFVTIVLHEDKSEILDAGALFNTYETSGGFISISKAIRLDKERCQRIISSPGLFILTAVLLKNDNKTIVDSDVMTFSYFTSLSITKAMLSLTEPARYMIMNSLALSSQVKEYIEEKFSPYTKTLFSVYMTELIKRGCMNANSIREKINLRNIHMSDLEMTQKGVSDDKTLTGIWFPGEVSLKEYINQVYLPFYFNSKGLHEKHHVAIDLAKTVLEIEKDQRESLPSAWGVNFEKQTVNLDILIYSLAENLMLDTSRHKHLRHRVESRNNFKRSLTTISTFTSSKSCIKIGDFYEEKSKQNAKYLKDRNTEIKKYKVANPLFDNEILEHEIKHSDYNDLIRAIPEYIDMKSTKVFDEMYVYIEKNPKNTIEEIMEVMKDHKTFYFTFFNKGQKTFKDREIFVGELQAKMCLYCIERISKERCKLNPEEMISEPGDGKLKKLEQKAEDEMRFIVENLQPVGKCDPNSLIEAVNKPKGSKFEINADMSKWSAQDVLFKYFWLFAMDPILYPNEKKRILYFLCNYMQKRLILPDEMMCSILDQKEVRQFDLIREMTENYKRNYVIIKRNWLQGNLNYTSSYLHSCSMSVYKEVVKRATALLDGKVVVNSLVHSDDNQTSVNFIQDKLSNDYLLSFVMKTFQKVCASFGNQVNMKKTYATNFIKEFVSLFNIYGEPYSVYGRFLLTCVGDCAYIGPYEDFASRLSATQTALKHGCPPSNAWLSIAMNSWMTYNTYNMLPGQANDPVKSLAMERKHIPIELGGLLNSELSTIALLGLESGNTTFLTSLLKRMSGVMIRRENVTKQVQDIKKWDISSLKKHELFYLKLLRYVYMDAIITNDSTVGETSEMRNRSLITPRKFTTKGSLKRLKSYDDYKEICESSEKIEELFQYMIRNPELLVTKGETITEYKMTILYRYNSKKFKESLSVQTPVQLMIEQILYSNKPTVDYNSISDKFYSIDDLELESDEIIGKYTISETLSKIVLDLEKLPLTNDDVATVYNFCICNDPLTLSIANSLILKVESSEVSRTGLVATTMPEIRNLKLIQYSPAIVIRAYIHSNYDFKGIDEAELRRDVLHLSEFIDKTGLKDRMEKKIEDYYNSNDDESLMFRLRELTKFYQICYDYIKSTEHKVKVFILPTRTYTSQDFISVVMGNYLSDKSWSIVHFLKPLEGNNYKGQVAKDPMIELQIADECFRLLAHFTDYFIADYTKKQFLIKILSEFKFKDFKVSNLWQLLKQSEHRLKFLPILYIMDELTNRDLVKYDSYRTDERITWNDWQLSQRLNIGRIDLVINGYNKRIAIYGEDNKLLEAILYIKRDTFDQIPSQSRKLLNARHNLLLEKMEPIKVLDSRSWYICYQKGRKNRYDYVVLNGYQINSRNKSIDDAAHRSKNYTVAVCPVGINTFTDTESVDIASVKNLNYEHTSCTKLKINEYETATIRRCNLSKMSFFDGPQIIAGSLNINNLIVSKSLLTLNYKSILKVDLLSILPIFNCNQTDQEIDFEFLSEEPVDVDEVMDLESQPVFSITVSKKSKGKITYKKAIEECIKINTEKFEDLFDFFEDGFYSSKNLGVIRTIVALIDELTTNEWSTKLKESIHLCMSTKGYDAMFHTFTLQDAFLLKDGVNKIINWEKIIIFLKKMPDIREEPWKEIFANFKTKAILNANEEMSKKSASLTLEDLAEELAEAGGHSKYQFH